MSRRRKTILNLLPEEISLPYVNWKGTPGVGDFMHGLNVAHWKSFICQKPVLLKMHWYHSRNYLYHFEDPETIIERFEYINKFYEKTGTEVNIQHMFNSESSWLYANRYNGYTRKNSKLKDLNGEFWCKFKFNDWRMRDDLLNYPIIEDKIVLWRGTTNAQIPRSFKVPFTHDQWNTVINMIELNGYRVVEIDYRTPISEVLYHIKTSRAVVCYEGMWHYIAKNLQKPIIVLSSDKITNYHTPEALIYNPRMAPGFDPAKGDKPVFSTTYFRDFERRLEVADKFSKKRIDYLDKLLNEYRQSSN